MLDLRTVVVTQQHIDNMFDTSWFIHSQIFDDVLLVSNKSTNCIVLKTTEGLILIDAIFPKKEMFDAIVSAIKDGTLHRLKSLLLPMDILIIADVENG